MPSVWSCSEMMRLTCYLNLLQKNRERQDTIGGLVAVFATAVMTKPGSSKDSSALWNVLFSRSQVTGHAKQVSGPLS